MLRFQQYRPILPTTVAGMRQYRKPYLQVSRRNKKMGSPNGLGNLTLTTAGGLTTGVLVFAGICALLAFVAGDYAIRGR